MTSPVSCLIEPGAGPACESTFTISFFIPEEHQADPPKPTDADAFIENRKELTVFVRYMFVSLEIKFSYSTIEKFGVSRFVFFKVITLFSKNALN